MPGNCCSVTPATYIPAESAKSPPHDEFAKLFRYLLRKVGLEDDVTELDVTEDPLEIKSDVEETYQPVAEGDADEDAHVQNKVNYLTTRSNQNTTKRIPPVIEKEIENDSRNIYITNGNPIRNYFNRGPTVTVKIDAVRKLKRNTHKWFLPPSTLRQPVCVKQSSNSEEYLLPHSLAESETNSFDLIEKNSNFDRLGSEKNGATEVEVANAKQSGEQLSPRTGTIGQPLRVKQNLNSEAYVLPVLGQVLSGKQKLNSEEYLLPHSFDAPETNYNNFDFGENDEEVDPSLYEEATNSEICLRPNILRLLNEQNLNSGKCVLPHPFKAPVTNISANPVKNWKLLVSSEKINCCSTCGKTFEDEDCFRKHLLEHVRKVTRIKVRRPCSANGAKLAWKANSEEFRASKVDFFHLDASKTTDINTKPVKKLKLAVNPVKVNCCSKCRKSFEDEDRFQQHLLEHLNEESRSNSKNDAELAWNASSEEFQDTRKQGSENEQAVRGTSTVKFLRGRVPFHQYYNNIQVNTRAHAANENRNVFIIRGPPTASEHEELTVDTADGEDSRELLSDHCNSKKETRICKTDVKRTDSTVSSSEPASVFGEEEPFSEVKDAQYIQEDYETVYVFPVRTLMEEQDADNHSEVNVKQKTDTKTSYTSCAKEIDEETQQHTTSSHKCFVETANSENRKIVSYEETCTTADSCPDQDSTEMLRLFLVDSPPSTRKSSSTDIANVQFEDPAIKVFDGEKHAPAISEEERISKNITELCDELETQEIFDSFLAEYEEECNLPKNTDHSYAFSLDEEYACSDISATVNSETEIETVFVCPYMCRSFKTAYGLNRHILSSHKNHKERVNVSSLDSIDATIEECIKAFSEDKMSASDETDIEASSAKTGNVSSRLKMTKYQREALLCLYKSNPYPDTSSKSDLAAKLDLTLHRISVWFQNKRAFERKCGRLPPLSNQTNIETTEMSQPETECDFLVDADEMFLCAICNDTFVNEEDLDDHLLTHEAARVLNSNVIREPKKSDKELYFCAICHQFFTRKQKIRKHMSIHVGVDRNANGSDSDLKNDGVHDLPNCEKPAVSESDAEKKALGTLENLPDVGSLYSCDHCNRSFSNKPLRDAHMLDTCDEKRFICFYCSRRFTKKIEIRRHIRSQHCLHRSSCPAGDHKPPVSKRNLQQKDDQDSGHQLPDKDDHHSDGMSSSHSPDTCKSSVKEETLQNYENNSSHSAHNYEQSAKKANLEKNSANSLSHSADDCKFEEENLQQNRTERLESCLVGPEMGVGKATHSAKTRQPVSKAEYLRRHSARLSNTGRYSCSVCGQSFRLKKSLRTHVLDHINPPFTCAYCHRSFSSEVSLKMHFKWHSNVFKCNDCDMKFLRKYQLREHILSATNTKLFFCAKPHCQKSFISNASLERHMFLHSSYKPHKCTVCGLSYSTKMALWLHMKQKHITELYSCSQCGRKFLSRSVLRKHSLNHKSRSRLAGSRCHRRFSQKDKLRSRGKKMRGQANTCTKSVKTKTGFTCDDCGKTFSKIRGLRCHMNHAHTKKP